MLWPSDRRREWNEFIAASPYGDVLQCWEWGELKQRTGWQPLPVAVERGGKLAAACLVLKRPLPALGKCLFYAPRGPIIELGDYAAAAQLGAAIRQLAVRHRAVAVKMDPAIEAGDEAGCRTLAATGFEPTAAAATGFGAIQPRYVMKVDISAPQEQLLAGFASKWRYNIRLAQRKGVVVKAAASRDEMDVFYDLLVITARRDGFVIRARSYFHDIWELLVEPGLASLFLAYVDEEAVAGAVVFLLGRQCWYVYGASSNRHRNKMPNHLLQWEIMRWAKAQGCTLYDMRGVAKEVDGQPQDEALAGLNRFKRGFNARYVEYVGEWGAVFSPLWYKLFAVLQPLAGRTRKWGARLFGSDRP